MDKVEKTGIDFSTVTPLITTLTQSVRILLGDPTVSLATAPRTRTGPRPRPGEGTGSISGELLPGGSVSPSRRGHGGPGRSQVRRKDFVRRDLRTEGRRCQGVCGYLVSSLSFLFTLQSRRRSR